jgi:Cu/Ag efflux pump CusA
VSRFAIKNPFFIIVVSLIILVVGTTSLSRMPVDMFPAMNIPVVVVATFYSGMPPEQIETDITSRFERFFTLGSGIEHMESRSLPGVSVIKVYFQPGTNRGFGCDHHFQPGHGAVAAASTGNAAARGAQVRRFELAGMPGHPEGGGT